MNMLTKTLILMFSMTMAHPALSQDPAPNDPWAPEYIYNLDLVGYAENLDGMIVEMVNSESARVEGVLEYDFDRLKSYSQKLRALITSVRSVPRADMPHSTGNVYSITYDSEGLDFGSTTNEAIRWITRWMSNMMVQATRSDSANATNGINVFDYDRQIQALDKLDAYIASYEAAAEPVDRPQFSGYERAKRAN